jgi:hypothetical protein
MPWTLQIRTVQADGYRLYAADAKLEVFLLIRDEKDEAGKILGVMNQELKLDKGLSGISAVSNAYTHTIDLDSPLYGLDKDQFLRVVRGITFTMSGTDSNSFMTTFMTKTWTSSDVFFGHRFKGIWENKESGGTGLGDVAAEIVHQVYQVDPFPSQERESVAGSPVRRQASTAKRQDSTWAPPTYAQGGGTMFRASVDNGDEEMGFGEKD